MKILKARINWHRGYENSPNLELLVDKIPETKDIVFEQKDNAFFGEKDGYVEFVYVSPVISSGACHLGEPP